MADNENTQSRRYVPYEWQDGDYLTTARMNHIEQGLKNFSDNPISQEELDTAILRNVSADTLKAVTYSVPEPNNGLSDTQQAQARANIGAISSVDLQNAINNIEEATDVKVRVNKNDNNNNTDFAILVSNNAQLSNGMGIEVQVNNDSTKNPTINYHTGILKASGFSGDGSQLTNLNGSQITNGGNITNLNADNIINGILNINYGGTGGGNPATARKNLNVLSATAIAPSFDAEVVYYPGDYCTHEVNDQLQLYRCTVNEGGTSQGSWENTSNNWSPLPLSAAIDDIAQEVNSHVSVMGAATSTTNGVQGLVPAPQAGDEGKFLGGDAQWHTVDAGVTGVKGNNEDNYRVGQVNLTPANLGAASAEDLANAISAIAEQYDEETEYNTGDYCIYNNKLYRCIADEVTGQQPDTEDSEYWEEATVMGSIVDVATNLNPESIGAASATDLAADYSPSAKYENGDYCTYNGHLYKCKANVSGTAPTGEVNDPYWVRTTVDEAMVLAAEAAAAAAGGVVKYTEMIPALSNSEQLQARLNIGAASTTDIGSLSTTITGLSTSVINLKSTVDNIGTTINTAVSSAIANIDMGEYSLTYGTAPYGEEQTDTENVLTLYKRSSGAADAVVQSQVIITGGGGGGSSQAGSPITLTRITNTPVVITTNDRANISVEYSSLNEGVPVQGYYKWYKGTQLIKSGNLIQGINTFDLTEYCSVGETTVRLIVNNEEGTTVPPKMWVININDIRLESNFNDKYAYNANEYVKFTYTPYGNVNKTIHFKLDGIELSSVTTTVSGQIQQYELPPQTHGAHLLEAYLTATINGKNIETPHIFKDIIWANPLSNVPIISCIYRYDHYGKLPIKQYNTFTIPYYIYNPTVANSTVILSENGNEVNTIVTDKADNTWAYKNSVATITYTEVVEPTIEMLDNLYEVSNGTYVLTSDTEVNAEKVYYSRTDGPLNVLAITCGSTSVQVRTEISPIAYNNLKPITANLAFDFNPVGYSNNDVSTRLWTYTSESQITTNLTVSNNFDWRNGGYQLDDNGNPYFCIKAGTRAYISYKLFQRDAKSNGAEFKCVFKTTNVGNASTSFLRCLTGNTNDPVGLNMKVHEANLITSADSLTFSYSEDDIIEFEYNINAIDTQDNLASSYIMTYEDGVGARPLIYDNDTELQQDNPVPIEIGSDDCDVYIYRMKAYTSGLTDNNILMNFCADAMTAEEMIDRYERNLIYNSNNILTPESVAEACPDLRVIVIDAPYFTNDKSNYIKNTTVQCIYKNGDPIYDNWTWENGYHVGQGTSSNRYGAAGRNIDIIFGFDGEHTVVSKIKENEVQGYISRLTLGDNQTVLTGADAKINLTRNSVPNSWFNIKVNIASSENANNALLQKRFNDYLPYQTPGMRRDPRIKNSMEFQNCVIFIRENDPDLTTHREFPNDTQYHFYGIGNIGDSKKTDNTRVNNPGDIREFVVEISDNNLPNSMFQTGIYWTDSTHTTSTYEKFMTDPEDSTKQIQRAMEDMKYPINLNTEWNINNGYIEVTDNELLIKDNLPVFYEKNNNVYTLTQDTAIEPSKTYYMIDYSNTAYKSLYVDLYKLDEKNKAYAVSGWDASFEFRYDMGTKDGESISDAQVESQQLLSKQVFRAMYEWVISATDENFNTHLSDWFIEESPLYWYLFTERYTMIDSRAKNTFWHWGKTYISDDEYNIDPETNKSYAVEAAEAAIAAAQAIIDDENSTEQEIAAAQEAKIQATYDKDNAEFIQQYRDCYIHNNAAAQINNGYRFDLWDYDNDTALGIDNSGILNITYGKEDIDYIEGSTATLYNAGNSVFWRRVRQNMSSKLATLYNSQPVNCWRAIHLINEFDAWQNQFPEELWRLDIERKYIRPYLTGSWNPTTRVYTTDSTFLTDMANGRKRYQRRQFDRDMEFYIATKYKQAAILADSIELRLGSPPTNAVIPANYSLSITPYSDMYLRVMYGNAGSDVVMRALAGQAYTINPPVVIDDPNTLQVVIYGASRIQALNDLSPLYIRDNNFSKASKLKTLIIGNNTAGYVNNNLVRVYLGDNYLLETLNVKNCPNATGSVNLTRCLALKQLYLTNTAFTTISIAQNGLLDTMQLEAPTGLSLRGLQYVSSISIADASNLTSLRIENCEFNDDTSLTIGNTTTLQGSTDLILVLVEAATNLSRLRLLDIDWDTLTTNTNTTLLDRLYNTHSIDDATLPSVITGKAKVPAISQRQLDMYYAVWPELEVKFTTKIEEYPITFLNADNSPILDLNGEPYIQYVVQGEDTNDPYPLSPPDAIKLVRKPTLSETAQYTYEFNGWDELPEGVGVNSPTTVHAVYIRTVRTYTVRWFNGESNTPLQAEYDIPYGSSVSYTQSYPPTITNGEGNYRYYVFTGWDKSTSFITGNTDVYATWSYSNGLPAYGTELKDMSLSDIYGIAASKRTGYWTPGDYYDIQVGRDYDYSNVESQTLISTPTYFDGAISSVKIYNGENGLPAIKLFDENSPSFTLAIDYEFIDSSVNTCLASCGDGTEGSGFRLRYEINPTLIWGNDSSIIGNGFNRNILVIRHNKTEGYTRQLIINYHNNNSYYVDTNLSSVLTRSGNNAYTTDGYLVLGGIAAYDNNTWTTGLRGKGWIHWCKIWYQDLGNNDCQELACWPHETWRMEYTGLGKDKNNSGLDSSKTTAEFFLSNPLPLKHSIGTPQNMNNFFNKLYTALPIGWQSIIKEVAVRTITGYNNNNPIVTTNMAKLYLPAVAEVGGSEYIDSSIYKQELNNNSSNYIIKTLTEDKRRIKFPGIILENIEESDYVEQSYINNNGEERDPTNSATQSNPVISGKTIWLRTDTINDPDLTQYSEQIQLSRVGYIYFDKNYCDAHKVICGRSVNDSRNINATGANYIGGKWIMACTWWTRTLTYNDNYYYYKRVKPNGSTDTNNWYDSYGHPTEGNIAFAFSI